MDKDKLDHDGSEGEESEKYLWVAALVIGILLILMVLAIASIAIWKYFKKENTADQNWAGPSPLADGNTFDDININSYVLGRNRSLSCISTAPIVTNELEAPQKDHASENTSKSHSEETSTEEDSKINNMPTLPYISSETTSFSSDASESQKCKQHLKSYSLNEEISLPPPPDDFLQFPLPPPMGYTNEFPVLAEESNMQPLPLREIQQSDEHYNQILLDQANTICMIDSTPSTYNIDDQLLPPPPEDLL
uniref:Uncharacterized protein n=1 Tax=Pyxicephalus adspersus TaxID=30357 RepID=A0AAV3B6F0_PYXAD|nr:TPA: hypothetical protein GDO54_001035 [Pyxicephalus adspersus]